MGKRHDTKPCLECGTDNAHDAQTCSACGGGSFQHVLDEQAEHAWIERERALDSSLLAGSGSRKYDAPGVTDWLDRGVPDYEHDRETVPGGDPAQAQDAIPTSPALPTDTTPEVDATADTGRPPTAVATADLPSGPLAHDGDADIDLTADSDKPPATMPEQTPAEAATSPATPDAKTGPKRGSSRRRGDT